jgi:RNA polymerase sigma-70 factor (ECF subfamily)
MCSYVRAQVGSAEAAEDLVQDVFLRIWQTRDRLDGNGSLRNLLYRSAHNAAINFLKHRTVEGRWQRERTSSVELTTSQDDPASFREVSTAVDHALAALPERCRTIFLMSRRQGLSYAEIAATLGLSVKTVETQMGRALKSLRAQLGQFLAL